MFRSHARSISFKMEHKGCSCVIRTQKVFYRRGFWVFGCVLGVRGCPGEKTKHQKAGFHNIKLKKGVRVKSEHKRCSGVLLEVLFTKWNTKGVPISC